MTARRITLLLALAVAALTAGPAQALTWSGRQAVDTAGPFGTHPAIASQSCPSSSLCFAVDSGGSLLRTRTPARANSWVGIRDVDPGRQLVGVSCASSTQCVAVDNEGYVAASSRPTGDASTWRVRRITGIPHFTSVSCPSVQLCVASDNDGRVATATRPVSGTWKVARIIPLGTENSIASIDCPSRTFCGARDAFGESALVSRNPAGGARAWQTINLPGPQAGGRGGPISCPTTSYCAIIAGSSFDGTGYTITSSNPFRAKSWVRRRIGFKDPQSLSCASSLLCVGGDSTGGVLVGSRSRTNRPLSWHRAQLGSTDAAVDAATCTRGRVCVLGDADGELYGSSRPAATASRWAKTANSLNQIPAVACPSAGLCIAGDTAGRLLSTTNPSSGPWSRTQITSGSGLTSLSCPSTAFCAAGDSAGQILTSTAPTGGGWTSTQASDSNDPVVSVSCPSTALCAAGLSNGFTASASPGSGDASTWKRSAGAYGDDEDAHVSCASATSCLGAVFAVETDASSEFPAVEYSANPASGADDAWTECPANANSCSQPPKPGHFMGVSCPTTTFCAVIDRRGNVFTTDLAGHWTATAADPGRILTGISCPTAGYCAAVDAQGGVVTSTNPAGPASGWHRQANVDRGLDAISCSSAAQCVATDDRGGVVAGS